MPSEEGTSSSFRVAMFFVKEEAAEARRSAMKSFNQFEECAKDCEF